MRHRLAMKVFLSGRARGDIQRARARVWLRWEREVRRLHAVADEVRLPTLLRKHRARRRPNPTGSTEVLWTELALLADPSCAICGGFGITQRYACQCSTAGLINTYQSSLRLTQRGFAWEWAPGQHPGARPRSVDLGELRRLHAVAQENLRLAEAKLRLSGFHNLHALRNFSFYRGALGFVQAARAFETHGADALHYADLWLRARRQIVVVLMDAGPGRRGQTRSRTGTPRDLSRSWSPSDTSGQDRAP